MSSSQPAGHYVAESMASDIDHTNWVFYFTRPADKEPIKVTWNLRSRFGEPWPVDLIKTRPPFLAAGFISNNQSVAVMRKFFPGLQPRESYPLTMFGQSADRHLTFIYELEGYLQKDWQAPINHILAGMNHFAQYLQGVVYIVQSPIKVTNNPIDTKTIMIRPSWAKYRRLIIFLVMDEVRRQYCLCWVDRKAGTIFLVDSHPDGYESMPTSRLNTIDRTLRAFLHSCDCAEPRRGITRLWNTRQEPDANRSDVHVMNNLRMLLLENQERITPQDSGYMNWSNSLCFQSNHVPMLGTKEETIRDMMITTFKMELGSKGRGLRWPEEPAVNKPDYKQYFARNDQFPEGGVYKPNRTFLPSNINIPELSVEDIPLITGRDTRSVSMMASHCFAMRQQTEEPRQFSQAPGTPMGTPLGTPFQTPQPGTPQPGPRKTKEQLMAGIRGLNRPDVDEMTPPDDRRNKKIMNRQKVVVQGRQEIRKDETTGNSELINKRFAFLRMGSEPQAGSSRLAAAAPQRFGSLEPVPQNYQASFLTALPERPRPDQPPPNRPQPVNARYSFRDRSIQASTPRPVDPDYDEIWNEPRHVVAQMDVPDGFKGWEYMMALERWEKGMG